MNNELQNLDSNELQMDKLFNSVYKNRKVLITGHTGFKGSWLALWLTKMGAEVCGYALEPPTTPDHFDLLNLKIESHINDIRDKSSINKIFALFHPDVVFHLAAQPLVRLSYNEPVETLETNIIGTANILEACRRTESVQAIVNVTSDKCYKNKEWLWGYRENDPMGGYDPYSVSKGCAELITDSYRNSFFNLNDYGRKHSTLLASCRAGNVIGGGDWAKDRLIPDIMKSASKNKTVIIRNPYATRPWQHVLEPLSGYLHVGQKLLEKQKEFAEGWNFGPGNQGNITVKNVVENIKAFWPEIKFKINQNNSAPHEAGLLKLDCSKAYHKLKWQEVWSTEKAFEKTTIWYKDYYGKGFVNTELDLKSYINDAKNKKLDWAKYTGNNRIFEP